MSKILNILMFLILILFISAVFSYYASKKNIKLKSLNRLNINKILEEKTSELPILVDDTSDIIEFNDSLKNEIKIDKKRSFWDLIKNK